MSLQMKLEQTLERIEGEVGVTVEHLQTGEHASINGDRLYQTASTIKVPILCALYKLAEQGLIGLEERVRIENEDFVPGSGVLQEMQPGLEVTVKDLATLMIVVSDNLATDKLLTMIGMEKVEGFMRSQSLQSTFVRQSIWELLCLSVGMSPGARQSADYIELERRLTYEEVDQSSKVYQRDVKDNNLMSPNDMAHLLRKITDHEGLAADSCNQILDIMSRQHFQNRIGGELPPQVKVASKSGSLFQVANDVGIVYLPDGSYTISVFTTGIQPKEQDNAIASISKVVFDHFTNSQP
ncbi:serine hydrolase [Sediminibacillus massiliensis]|uniref:serine hydrolase n=1 Tax=Sediminibacillus massiliensis TaxID=1926277 RepID=UPI0015C34DA6|nr:serine hydrolase [Sediminibacillus massiliensis]